MSTFDPTSRVNAIRANAETAKGLIDLRAQGKVNSVFVSESSIDIRTRMIHDIWEKARLRKQVLHETAIAAINEIWADWNEAEAKERKKRTK